MNTTSRIAIIGAGIAGIGAAWRLHQQYDITLYEAGAAPGGHAQTVTISTSEGPVSVDIGMQAMILPDYANLAATMQLYGVEIISKPLSYGTSISKDVYWSNLSHNTHLAFWERVKDDAERFAVSMRELLMTRPIVELGQLALKDYLQIEGYTPQFIYNVAYPMLATLLFAYEVMPETSLALIAAMFVDDLGSFTSLSDWCYVHRTYANFVDRITAEFRDRMRLNTRVTSVTREHDCVIIEDEHGYRESYDQVVFATPGDMTLSLLGDASAEEMQILAELTTRHLQVTLHRDESVLSPYFQERPIVQFTTRDGDPYHGANHFDVKQWHDLEYTSTPILMSMNCDIAPQHIYATRSMDIDRVTPQAMYSRLLLQTIQGTNRTWYCGRSVTFPSFEEAYISGLVIAEYLGVAYPFPDDPHLDFVQFRGKNQA
jgi:predicted NAD/FAD-binding protein